MPFKDKQRLADYKKANYGRICLELPNDEYLKFKEYCSKNGLKMNTLIRSLIRDKISSV